MGFMKTQALPTLEPYAKTVDRELVPCERPHLGVQMLSQSRLRARSSLDVTARTALGRAQTACWMQF